MEISLSLNCSFLELMKLPIDDVFLIAEDLKAVERKLKNKRS